MNQPSMSVEFLQECNELCERFSANLAKLEKGDYSAELVDEMYRDMHTIKGSAYLVGYTQLGEIAHAMETCLDPIRRGVSRASARLFQSLYHCIDAIESLAASIQKGEALPGRAGIEPLVSELFDASAETVGGTMGIAKDVAGVAENLDLPAVAAPAPQAAVAARPVNAPAAQPAPVAAAPAAAVHEPAAAEGSGTIRVPVMLLDKLMTLMGEMVLVRNQVLQYSNHHDDLEFLNLSQRLDVVTSELQGEVMKTRMQPIGNVLAKFQRVIRDLGQDLGKRIELTLSGAETELDKTLLEAIKDPLTHILRNSCDHGIELPSERAKNGKSETGHISIRSFHEGGQVIIEISDDGAGLNRDKLLNKAVEKGLITPDRAAAMSEREVFGLIFAPGFSTVAHVTSVSGRGVGMDVVKSNVEKIGGIVEILSQPGRGTTTRLKIPLTLAIVPAMIVSCQSDLYAIPQVKLVELVRVEKGSGRQIEYLQGKPVYRLRGNLLPLLDLKEVLGLPPRPVTSDVVNLVVLNGERKMFGLIVEEIQDTADIVVKPLSRFLKSLSVYSGATVLGNGAVALILDVIGIAQRMLPVGESRLSATHADHVETKARRVEEVQEFLLFRLNAPAKHALPLGLVHRLEEFKRSSIEYSGSQRVVRYRNSILPIISLNEILGYGPGPAPAGSAGDVMPVIVTQKGNRSFGIEVNEILDVLTTEVQFDASFSDRPGLLGNIISGEEVVVIVDTLSVLDQTANRLGAPLHEKKPVAREVQILMAEDAPFFRKHISSVLVAAGYKVTMGVNGEEALDLLKANPAKYDLILSDIEMPKMNGLEFAASVRQDPRWKDIPMIALTTQFGDKHVAAGKRAGFTYYLEKMNPSELLTIIDKVTENLGEKRSQAA